MSLHDALPICADDFKGLDLDGKIAVLFGGAPARFDNDRRAFHSSYREKLREVAERGAIGPVFVNTAQDEAGAPWAARTANWNKPAMRLRDARSEEQTYELQSLMRISYAVFCLKKQKKEVGNTRHS